MSKYQLHSFKLWILAPVKGNMSNLNIQLSESEYILKFRIEQLYRCDTECLNHLDWNKSYLKVTLDKMFLSVMSMLNVVGDWL